MSLLRGDVTVTDVKSTFITAIPKLARQGHRILAHGVSRGNSRVRIEAPSGATSCRTVSLIFWSTQSFPRRTVAPRSGTISKPSYSRTSVELFVKSAARRCSSTASPHVHLLIRIPADMSVAECLRKVKANSSKSLRGKWPGQSDFAWQTGYAAFSVSLSNRDHVYRYIRNQQLHHAKVSFADEIAAFIRKYGGNPTQLLD
jgi:transposase IS200 family protein